MLLGVLLSENLRILQKLPQPLSRNSPFPTYLYSGKFLILDHPSNLLAGGLEDLSNFLDRINFHIFAAHFRSLFPKASHCLR